MAKTPPFLDFTARE